MKKHNILFLISLAILSTNLISCSEESNTLNTNPIVNNSALKLFAIDTAKVNTISITGTNEVTILDKSVNSSSYIADFCLSPDGKKFIYVNHQMTGVVPNLSFIREIRIANSDGSGDAKIYEVTQNQVEIEKIRYCTNNKIMFSTRSNQGGSVNYKVYEMNDDGTQVFEVQFAPNFDDVSINQEYYLVSNDNNIIIYDADADNGAPGTYHIENISATESYQDGVFTNDEKTVVIPYKEGTSIKAKVIDMAAKTSNTIELITNLGAGWFFYQLEMSSDSKRGIITISGSDYTKSKSYIFNIKTGIVQNPFENNDENVFSVYAW